MEGRPSKRRRTDSPAEPTNAPTNLANDEKSNKRRRPSFASPTRASLARHNPEILERRLREEQGRRDRLPSSRPDPPSAPRSNPAAASEPERRSSREAQQEASHLSSAPRSPTRKVGGALASRPKRTPSKARVAPPARPKPDPVNPFQGRSLRRSPRSTASITSDVPDEVITETSHLDTELQGPDLESELPPTPTQRGLEDPIVTTPPSGIHNTPSKHALRLQEKTKSSSPLKQPPMRPPQSATEGIEIELPSSSRPSGSELAERRGPHPARGIKPVDPHAGRKALRASLQAELAQLEADVALASKENERLARLQAANKRDNMQAQLPQDRDALIDLLTRHVLPSDDVEVNAAKPTPPEDVMASIFNPVSLLSAATPLLPTKSNVAKEKMQPLPSHRPIPLSADEALPFLRTFTPLLFTSSVSTLPLFPDEPRTLQRHTIAATSPDGLFAAQIEMIVDTTILAIARLAVPKLCAAAVPELGGFISSLLSDTSNNTVGPVARKNIAILGWACGEWYRVAVRRARVWAALEKELSDADSALAESVRRLRGSAGRKGIMHVGDQDEDEEEEDSDEGVDGPKKKITGRGATKSQIRRHLGRSSMEFCLPDSSSLVGGSGSGTQRQNKTCIRMVWNIGFDWTGEARSELGILVGVPGKWHKADNTNSIPSLPGIFDRLVREERDPVLAVRTIVALLVGDVRA